ncbi:hypothetical protein [Rhizobium sp. NPDC090279]
MREVILGALPENVRLVSPVLDGDLIPTICNRLRLAIADERKASG